MSIFGLCNLPRDTINRLYGDKNGDLIPKNSVHPGFSNNPVIPNLPETVPSIVGAENDFNKHQKPLHPEPEKIHKSPVIAVPDNPQQHENENPINNADNPINDISFKDYAEKQAQAKLT